LRRWLESKMPGEFLRLFIFQVVRATLGSCHRTLGWPRGPIAWLGTRLVTVVGVQDAS
jgi:hypothetical protein